LDRPQTAGNSDYEFKYIHRQLPNSAYQSKWVHRHSGFNERDLELKRTASQIDSNLQYTFEQ